MIQVVNKHTHKPTENDIYVGRGSILGNPYTSIHGHSTKAEFTCETREESIKCFSSHLKEMVKSKDKAICDELNRIWKIAKSGHHVNLVCYCSPKSCHATIIKRTLEQTLRIHKTYEGDIESLLSNQIAVAGTNTQGRHGKGFAQTCLQKHGAIYGQARGIQGKTFGIVTKDLTKSFHPSRTVEEIKLEIRSLYNYAIQNPELEFLIPYKGDAFNLNFYSGQDMADMFGSMEIPKNIVFESGFYSLIYITFP